jgi:TP901 family phage tail tape measure protein
LSGAFFLEKFMATFTVEYLFRFSGNAIAQAQKISAASQKARSSIHAMGGAFNAMEAGANRAGAALTRLAAKMRAIKTTGRGAMLGGLGTGAGVYTAGRSLLTRYAEFEQAEIFARALGKELKQTDQAMNHLVSTARKLGATTMFEPQDVLKGGNTFLKAGRSAAEAANLLPSVLNLAAVADMTVEKAANDTLNFMAQANIPAEKLKVTIDALAATFMSAKAEMGQLANAAGYLLPTLAPLGVALEQQFAILGTLSESGQSGSRGARGFSMAISSLIKGQHNKSKAKLMNQYGLNMQEFMTPDGKVKGGDIMPLMRKLLDVEKKSGGTFIDRFFPANAARMLKSFFSRFEVMDKILGNMKDFEGATERVAKTKFEGIIGAVRQLSAAWSELSIVFGEGGLGKAFEGWVRYATSSITSLGNAFKELSPGMKSTISNVALIGGALALAVVPLGIFAMAMGALIGPVLGISGGLRIMVGLLWNVAAGMTGAFMGPVITATRMLGVIGGLAMAFRQLRAIAGKAIVFTILWEGSKLLMNWDKVKASFAEPLKVNVIWPDAPGWFKWIVSQFGQDQKFVAGKGPASAMNIPGQLNEMFGKLFEMFGKLFGSTPTVPKLPIDPNAAQKYLPQLPAAGGAGRFAAPGLAGGAGVPLPVQRVQVQNDVKITGPNSITLKLPNGGVAGTIQLGAERSRGDASTSSGTTEKP